MALNHWELALVRMDAYQARMSRSGVVGTGKGHRKGFKTDGPRDHTHPAHLHDRTGRVNQYIDFIWAPDFYY